MNQRRSGVTDRPVALKPICCGCIDCSLLDSTKLSGRQVNVDLIRVTVTPEVSWNLAEISRCSLCWRRGLLSVHWAREKVDCIQEVTAGPTHKKLRFFVFLRSIADPRWALNNQFANQIYRHCFPRNTSLTKGLQAWISISLLYLSHIQLCLKNKCLECIFGPIQIFLAGQ